MVLRRGEGEGALIFADLEVSVLLCSGSVELEGEEVFGKRSEKMEGI